MKIFILLITFLTIFFPLDASSDVEMILGKPLLLDVSSGIEVQLVWEQTFVDLDLYIISPTLEYCYWNNQSPDWGCQYDYDSVGGVKSRQEYGDLPDPFPYTEQATIDLASLQKLPGTYRIGVHNYDKWANTPDEPVSASIDMYQFGNFLGNFPFTLNKGEAKIIWQMLFENDEEQPPLPQCSVYGVHDEGRNSSVFFRLDAKTHEVILLSTPGQYDGRDVEALDIHPETHMLFATSSKDADPKLGGQRGMLYQLDKENGQLSKIGYTGYDSVDSLSFHPNGELYGWAKGVGLITIDTSNGTSKRVPLDQVKEVIDGTVLSRKPVNDIAWNPAGTKLYLAEGKNLWVYHLGNNRIDKVSELQNKTEALEMTTNNILLVGFNNDKRYHIHALDVNNNCQEITNISMPSLHNDIEGLAWICN